MKKINNNYIFKDQNVSEIIKLLNKSEEKICFVVDRKKRVIGIYNDGDLRRVLTKKNFMLINADKYCNKKFVFIFKDKIKKETVVSLFKKNKDIQHLPVLDRSKRLIGIFKKEDFLEKEIFNNEILILAGGLGERLKPLTSFLPKPMLNFGGKPLLESQLYSLHHFGFRNINISVNYFADKIINYFGNGQNYDLKINYFKEKTKLGTAGPLFFLKNKNNNLPIIVLNGDIYSSLNFKELLMNHMNRRHDVTICTNNFEIQIPYGVINKKNREKNKIIEKPRIKFEINSGIYVFNPKILKILKKKFLNMNDLINDLKKRRFRIGTFKIYEPIIDIGNFETYESAKNIIKNV